MAPGGGHSFFKDSDEARKEEVVDIGELGGPGEAWWGVKGQMRDDFNLRGNRVLSKQDTVLFVRPIPLWRTSGLACSRDLVVVV